MVKILTVNGRGLLMLGIVGSRALAGGGTKLQVTGSEGKVDLGRYTRGFSLDQCHPCLVLVLFFPCFARALRVRRPVNYLEAGIPSSEAPQRSPQCPIAEWGMWIIDFSRTSSLALMVPWPHAACRNKHTASSCCLRAVHARAHPSWGPFAFPPRYDDTV